MARQVNAADMVKAYKAGVGGAAEAYKKGVGAVTENPAAKAAAKVADGTWARNTTAAADRMQQALSAVTLSGWQQQSKGVGATNFAQSAAKAGPKYEAKAQQLAQAATAASAAAEQETDPIAKVRAAINTMRAAYGKPPI